ncbi:MAG: maltose alpha-D-glucosyltransferase, partial [Deltaproteobacteria bacterium]|nr:maltose alpha-D-glucosyltransferase [Deltaproteobacteria bacterium]
MTMDSLWYKDAIFYELHVRAFADSNADGIGDFVGARQKLDYLHDLGVTCLWLLPFYPSPLRDDGYDVSDHCQVHPQYGTLADCCDFLAAAHERGMRVIFDLVVNHTSDQHPWFLEARSSAQSSKHDYYVWSDTPGKYRDARIIFKDFESSNWTWDPVAQAYYWHRFFHHQPDLNYDNPEVQREMLDVMRFWLERGVDGFRCDAVPYLFEREGTNCENLLETHAYFKHLRAELTRSYPGCILLAEASQGPEIVRSYFGDGDESHLAFHFPLTSRLFLALRREERAPLVDILTQTLPIPETCQWATFLRNHDELSLSQVTKEEREYLLQTYAKDPRMRLNAHIRRRLAPLLDNDRRQIELLHSLIFTLPGSPVLYYGDELGMGDNIELDDRNGLRTPMQWNGGYNAGFSQAAAEQLYLPVISDPVYGYQTVNVQTQLRAETSLLRWLQRVIAVRKQHPAFGRGTIDFLDAANKRVLAYIRRYGKETLLIVHNLSDSGLSVELDLQRFCNATPIDLLSNT